MFISKKHQTFNDQELLSLLKVNDEKAYKEVYERYWQKLLTLAIYKTNSKDKGLDCVQDIFIKLWENRATLEIENLENYLFGSLKYQIVNQLRTILKNKVWIDLADNDQAVEIQDFLTVQDLENIIDKTLLSLPPKTCEIFKQSRFESLSHSEISLYHDMSVKAVEYHITKALKVFKEQLKDFLPIALFALFQ